MKKNTYSRGCSLLLAVVLPAALASGCSKSESPGGPGPAEKAGKAIDKAAKEAGTAIVVEGKKAADATKDAAEKAGEAIEKGAEKVSDGAKAAAHKAADAINTAVPTPKSPTPKKQ